MTAFTVLITGATAGIGAACARRFVAPGAHLVLTGRRAERLDETKRRLEAAGKDVKVHTLALDMRDRRAVERMIETLPSEFGEIDVLVNNAGLALGLEPAHRVALDDWEAMVDTNIKGLICCTRAVLPGMVERNRGHIVNLGSVAGTYPYPGGNVYGGTKAFVHQFSLALRSDLLGTNVRVTCIEPGMVETEFAQVRFKGDRTKAAQTYAGMQPMTADDIADVIHWCVSRPAHLNINTIELMPVAQAFNAFAVARQQE
ncbi:MAG TPA: SDR family oxidoreductase [Alphaproteobacteria bacterium]|nr:SDR family oxidoreductase [Alphaproteobacteria bacterium]